MLRTREPAEALKAYRDASPSRAPRQGRSRQCGWQRDLSVAYNRVGDVLKDQGNLPEALKAYRDSLAIGERLAKADPGNAGWQRDLSVAYEKVGDVLKDQGNLTEALKAYRDGLAISRAPRQGRSRQCRMAARSLGLL